RDHEEGQEGRARWQLRRGARGGAAAAGSHRLHRRHVAHATARPHRVAAVDGRARPARGTVSRGAAVPGALAPAGAHGEGAGEGEAAAYQRGADEVRAASPAGAARPVATGAGGAQHAVALTTVRASNSRGRRKAPPFSWRAGVGYDSGSNARGPVEIPRPIARVRFGGRVRKTLGT